MELKTASLTIALCALFKQILAWVCIIGLAILIPKQEFKEGNDSIKYEGSTGAGLVLFWFWILLIIPHLISTILLIVGILKGIAWMMLPWLIISAIMQLTFMVSIVFILPLEVILVPFTILLQKFCFSIELRFGCIGIGISGIVTKALTLLSNAVSSAPITMEHSMALTNLPPWFFGLLSFWDIGRIILGIFGILFIIFCTMLIIGAISEKIWMVLPYVGLTVGYVIFSIAIGMYTGIQTEQYFIVLIPIAAGLVDGYFMLVVISWYLEKAR